MHTVKKSLTAGILLGLALSAAAQPATDVAPPVYKPGDTWTWAAVVSPRDTCSAVTTGAKLVQTIESVAPDGFTSDISGPQAGVTTKRVHNKDLSYESKAGESSIKSQILNFPLTAGKAWDTSIGSGNVVQTLSCKSSAVETLAVGGEQYQVVPIVCNGRWKNLSTGSSDQSILKFWYSPKVANFVKQTIFTYFRGGTCVDVEYRLESHKVNP